MSYQVGKTTAKRSRPSYVYSVLSVMLVLFMLGILGCFLSYSNTILRFLKENIEISLVLKNSANEAEILQYQKKLDKEPYVKSSKYVSKEEALKIMSKEFGDDLSLLDNNPLYGSIILNLKAEYANPDSLKVLKAQFTKNEMVDDVFYQEQIVDVVNKNVRRVGFIFGGVALLLFIIALTLIDSTIKLAMYSNRFLIKSMQLVGATRWFIIKPFIGRSVINGLVAGMVAVIGLITLLYYVQENLPEIQPREEDLVNFALIFAGVVITGILISLLSTWRAVRKYLRLKLDDLY
jgi:cell division transport system permease protein